MNSENVSRRHFMKSSLVTSALVAQGMSHRASAAKGEWITLFDGKTLRGWHLNPKKIGHGTGGQWAVEDGVISGQQDPPGSGNGGILLTDRKFGDFVLSIDMKPDWGVCSGLFLRGTDRGQCFQMMVDYHDSGSIGHIYGEGTGGFNTRTFDINGKYDKNKRLVGMTTAKHKKAEEVGLVESCTPEQWLQAWKLNGWNTAKVRVSGGKYPLISTWINGLKVCVFDADKSSVGKYNKEKVSQVLGTHGSVAVQVHGGGGWPKGAKCRWKNIKIRPLT